jgi:DNA-binding HxlR family transcriptional regulator
MDRKCAVYRTAGFVGKRWTILILLELYKGGAGWKRYSHLKGRLMDITPKILSARLKELEKEEMVSKRIDASAFPVKSEYSLTDSGRDFIGIIKSIREWSLKWKVSNRECEKKGCEKCDL